jgi:predicted nuclease with TOPRIM domain
MQKYEKTIDTLINTGEQLLAKVSNFNEKMKVSEVERTKVSAMVMKQMINTLDVKLRMERLSQDLRENETQVKPITK